MDPIVSFCSIFGLRTGNFFIIILNISIEKRSRSKMNFIGIVYDIGHIKAQVFGLDTCGYN